MIDQPAHVKIATWNIGGGIIGDSHQTNGCPVLNYYAETLRDHRPNIICLQESHHYSNDTNQVKDLAHLLGYKYSVSTPVSASHLEPYAHLALGLISEYPITSSTYTAFDNPRLTAIGPRGDQWNLFDKGYCTHTLNAEFGTLSVLNAHCFPFHYFSATATEERFLHIWESLVNGLKAARKDTPCLAAIDLNFGDIRRVIGAELTQESYINAIDNVPTTPKSIQQDFILYTPDLRLLTTSVIPTKSDHHLCITEFG